MLISIRIWQLSRYNPPSPTSNLNKRPAVPPVESQPFVLKKCRSFLMPIRSASSGTD